MSGLLHHEAPGVLKQAVRALVRHLFQVEISGLEHYRAAGERVLIIANHTSFLDGVLLTLFLPDRLTFAVNTRIAEAWWVRFFLSFVGFVTLDTARPFALRGLATQIRQGSRVVIFPEGRITLTGSLMKIYAGAGLVADRSGACLLPVGIDGPQFSRLARWRRQGPRRWFPKVRIQLRPAVTLKPLRSQTGRSRREAAARRLRDLMAEVVLAARTPLQSLPEAMVQASIRHGVEKVVLEDMERRPLSYRGLLRRAWTAARILNRCCPRAGRIGLLMPSSAGTVIALLAVILSKRTPVLLDPALSPEALARSCASAKLEILYTARAFVESASMQDHIDCLSGQTEVLWLEDLPQQAGYGDWLWGRWMARWMRGPFWRWQQNADETVVILFPADRVGEAQRGLVYSHRAMLVAARQLNTVLDAGSADTMMNLWPVSNPYGLIAGIVLPLITGMRVFCYPKPTHARIVPELAYDVGATVMMATESLLAAYLLHAHPYDFYSLRYVFAPAPVSEAVRQGWLERFGVRVLESYGRQEAGPVIALNTPLTYRRGTVGYPLPGIVLKGHDSPGQTLQIRSPGLMTGWLEENGDIRPLLKDRDDWLDTGEILICDEDGFLYRVDQDRATQEQQ